MKSKKKILLYAVNALLLIIVGICLMKIHGYSKLLESQQAAAVWKGDSEERFAQVSCFFPDNAPANTDLINNFRKSIDGKLIDAGMEPKKDKTETYWTDCYSGSGSLKVKGEKGTADVTAIGVGGDFFLFHPYQLLSGGYLNKDDIMQDRVVLDYELAWQLFGGTSLEGMTVTINNKPYYIAGVVRRETDLFSKKAYTGDPIIFMSYSGLTELNDKTGISSYEVAMPDPISSFAVSFVRESFKTAKGVAVENSTRYQLSEIYKMFSEFGSRSIENTGISYPYWENAARVSEVYIGRLYVIILLLLLFPFVCLMALSVKLIKLIVVKAKIWHFKVKDAWDDRYAREAAWKERQEQKKNEKKVRPPLTARLRAQREQLARGRRDRILKNHEKKNKQSPADGEVKKKKSKLPAKKKASAPPDTADSLEKEVVPDIESIVREVMEEMHGQGRE